MNGVKLYLSFCHCYAECGTADDEIGPIREIVL